MIPQQFFLQTIQWFSKIREVPHGRTELLRNETSSVRDTWMEIIIFSSLTGTHLLLFLMQLKSWDLV